MTPLHMHEMSQSKKSVLGPKSPTPPKNGSAFGPLGMKICIFILISRAPFGGNGPLGRNGQEHGNRIFKNGAGVRTPDPGRGSKIGHLGFFGGVVEYPGLEKRSPDSLGRSLDPQKGPR